MLTYEAILSFQVARRKRDRIYRITAQESGAFRCVDSFAVGVSGTFTREHASCVQLRVIMRCAPARQPRAPSRQPPPPQPFAQANSPHPHSRAASPFSRAPLLWWSCLSRHNRTRPVRRFPVLRPGRAALRTRPLFQEPQSLSLSWSRSVRLSDTVSPFSASPHLPRAFPPPRFPQRCRRTGGGARTPLPHAALLPSSSSLSRW